MVRRRIPTKLLVLLAPSLFCGCSWCLFDHPLFSKRSCEGGEPGCCYEGDGDVVSDGPVLDGCGSGSCGGGPSMAPPTTVPPFATPLPQTPTAPLTSPPRLVPQPQSQPAPYVPGQ